MSLHPGLIELQSRSATLIWKLEIGGLPIIYHNAPGELSTPDALDAEGEVIAGLSYALQRGLTAPSSQTQVLDLVTGLTESTGGLSVNLASAGQREDTAPLDPVRVLGRLGIYGADWSADLLESMPHQADGPTAIKISRDPSSLSFPRIFYIGQEAIWATGHGGSGSLADPYTLTGVRRGILGSPVQRHTSNPARGDIPLVTSDKIHWASARATISVANLRTTDGSLGEWVEIVHGTLSGAPKILNGGSRVGVTVVPLANKLTSKLGGGDISTRLKDGKHYFRWPYASKLWARTILPRDMLFGRITSNAPAGSAYIPSEVVPFNAHRSVFDPDVAGRAPTDPRRGPINSSADKDEVLWPDGYATDAPLGERFLLLSPNSEGALPPVAASSSTDSWGQPQIKHTYTVDICTEVEGEKVTNWPGDVLAIWNGSEGLNPRTTQGEHGQFVSIRFSAAERAYFIQANSPWIRNAQVYVNPQQFGLLDEEVMWYPIQPEEGGVGLAGSQYSGNAGAVRDEDFNQPARTAAAEVPTAFYQFREATILVEDDAPADPPFDIKIDLSQIYGDEVPDELSTARVVSSTYSAEGEGFVWELEDNRFLPSFGNFAGVKPTISPVIRLRGEDVIEVLLKVICSGAGQGVNSAEYDVFPFGLNIPEERVDLPSFLAFPRGIANWERSIEAGVDVRETFEGILDLLGAAIVSRLDLSSGTYKLALVSVSLASPAESILELGEADCDGLPRHLAVEQKFNRVEYTLNPPEGNPFVAGIDDQAAQAATETGILTRKVSLEGLKLGTLDVGEVEGFLRLAYSRKRALLAFSRRRYGVKVPMGLSYRLSLGSVITISHSLLVPGNPGQGRGVDSVPVRVVEIERNFSDGFARLVLEYSAANTTGWAPSLRVASVSDTTTVIVESNAYTGTVHPYSGAAWTDLREGEDGYYFEVGDEVQIYTEGDWASRVITTITSINYETGSVEFSDAHGASPGTVIDPGPWSTASARMRGFAFLASRAGLEGSPAKVYS